MKRLLPILLCAGGLSVSPAARADDSVTDAVGTARFEEGLAHARRGQYEPARVAFLQALAVEPMNTNVLLNLAVAETALARKAEALGHLRQYLKSPKVDPQRAAEVQRTLYADLVRATGHLNIQAEPGAPIVLDDNVRLGNAPLADVLDVMPGKHTIAAGMRVTALTISAGETKDVVLVDRAKSNAPGSAGGSSRVYASRGMIFKPLTFVLGGATLAALGAAVYYNVRSHDAADEARALREGKQAVGCSGPGASPECVRLSDAIDTQGSAADASRGFWIGFGVLAALTVTSGVLAVTARSSQSTSGVLAPAFGRGFAAATYRVDF